MARKVLSLLVVLAIVALAGCTKSTQAPGQPSTGEAQVITLNLGDEPPSMDPQKSTDTISFDILSATQEGLVRRVDALGSTPKGSGLAKDWTVSADQLTWTFTLKDGLKWSDGKPITAKEFEFAWKRALDPRTASEYAYQLYYVKGGEALNSTPLHQMKDGQPVLGADDKPVARPEAEVTADIEKALATLGVRATDDKTLVVTLESPTPYFLTLLYFPTYFPTREDLVKQHGDKFAADADKNVYSGPFVMSTWTHESEMTLKKNPNYWDAAKVKLAQINFKMVKESNTYLNMFDAGELDSTGVPGDFISTYKDKGLKQAPEATTFYLEFNTRDAVFKNQKIRKAFSMAIDRTAFAENVLKDGSIPATGYVPPSIPGLSKPFREESGRLISPAADVDGAKKMLADGLQELGLSKLPKITLLSGDSTTAKRDSQAMQEFLQKNLGIEVVLENVAFKVRLQKMTGGDFQVVYAGWGADYEDPMTFMDMFVKDGGHNNSKWANAEHDRLILEIGKKSNDQKARMEAMAKAEQILMEEMPIAPLYFRASNYVERSYVKGRLRFAVGAGNEFKYTSVEGRSQ